jgi:hypothetical protein
MGRRYRRHRSTCVGGFPDHVIHKQGAASDSAMQLCGDEAGLLSHNGELLLKSGQTTCSGFTRGAEQYHRPYIMFNLFRQANLIVHLDDFQRTCLETGEFESLRWHQISCFKSILTKRGNGDVRGRQEFSRATSRPAPVRSKIFWELWKCSLTDARLKPYLANLWLLSSRHSLPPRQRSAPRAIAPSPRRVT